MIRGVDGSKGHVSRVSYIFGGGGRWRRHTDATRTRFRVRVRTHGATLRAFFVRSRLFRAREADVARAFASAGGITDKRRSIRAWRDTHVFARAFGAPGETMALL